MTVQTKAISCPCDVRLCHRVRERLVKADRKEGFEIQVNYVRAGRGLCMKQSCHAHTRQMKRPRATHRKLKTSLGGVISEGEKQRAQPEGQTPAMLAFAEKIHIQTREISEKSYRVYKTDVQCIAKGKAGERYEFGNKLSLAVTSKQSWVIGNLSLEGCTSDRNKLRKQICRVRSIVGVDKVKGGGHGTGYVGHKH